MIKKQRPNSFLDSMKTRKILGLFLVLGLFISLGSANIAEITSKDISPVYVDEQEQITFTMSVQGDDGIEELGIIVTDPDGNTVKDTITTYDGSQTQVDFTDFLTLGSVDPQGEYDVEFYTKDGALTYSEYDTFYYKINEPTPTWNLISPDDGETFNYPADETGADVPFETDITPESSGNVELFIDFQDGNGFNSYYSETVSGGGTVNIASTELVSEVSNAEYFFKYTRDSTGNDFNSNVRTFNVNEVDNPPTIDSVSTNPSNIQVGDSVDVSFTASDDVGLSSFDIFVYDVSTGNQIASTSGSLSGTSDSVTVGNLFSPSETGDYQIEISVEDSNGQLNQDSTGSFTKTVSSETSPTFSLDNPSSGETFNIATGDSTTSVSYSGTVNSEFSGTVYLYRDGSQIDTSNLVSGGDSYSFSESLPSGSYNYYIEAVSDATGSTYTSNSKSFSVSSSSETQPTFTLDSPNNGETITYPEADSSADVSFAGNVEAPWNGTGNLSVQGDGITGSVKLDLVHTADQTFYEYNETLTQGNFSYYIELQSSQTGNVYTSQTYNFEVFQTDEPRPTQTINQPNGSYKSSQIVEPLSYDVVVDSQINGTTTLSIIYPNGYNQQVKQSSINSGSYSFNDSIELLQNEREPGDYKFKVKTVSTSTGNNYVDDKTFTIEEKPVFNQIQPDNTTVLVREPGDKFAETQFFANLSYVDKGIIRYEIRKPSSTSWQQIESQTVTSFTEYTELDFKDVIDNLQYVSSDDQGRKYTENFTGRITFTSDKTGSTYTSKFTEFNFKEPELTGLVTIERTITDALGDEYGLVIAATFIILLSSVYVGLFSKGTAVLMVVLAEVTTFSILGWYPGWVAMILFMFGIGIGYKIFTSDGG